MRRRLALLAMVLGMLGLVGVNPAQGSPDPNRDTGNACPHDDRTPPNCGKQGGGGGGGGTGNACPPSSPNPDGTPPNCGHPPCDDDDDDDVCDEDDTCPDDPGDNDNGCPDENCANGVDDDGDGATDADDSDCPTTTYPGPCHRGEGILGEDGLNLAQEEAQENPLAEQLYHELSDLPIEHPGDDETEASGDNSSLDGPGSKDLYEAEDLPLNLGPEAGCATDLLGPIPPPS